MAPSDPIDDVPWRNQRPTPILVEREADVRPFMTGILVASLVESEIPFATAYATALQVERRLRERQAVAVKTGEITALVSEFIGYDPKGQTPPAKHDILVFGAGGSLPFSKGVLSQSLLAAAVDPVDAFEVAREIEQDLRSQNLRRISRADLRALAHRGLERRAGTEASARYLAWRRYEEPQRPVIVLLGGTSGVGKTTLALEVARRMGIGRVLSTDSIRQVMRLMISHDLMPWIHASSYEAGPLVTHASEIHASVIDGFRAQATSVSVGVHACIDRSVEESANLIVDGVSLLPGVIDLARYRGKAVVVFCLVATRDEMALRKRFEVRASGQPQRLAARYLENLEGIVEIQRHLVDEANKRKLLVVDNIELDQSAIKIIAHVLDTLRDHHD